MAYIETVFRVENGADADIPEVRLELNLRHLVSCWDFDRFDKMVEMFKERSPTRTQRLSSFDSSRYVKFKDSTRRLSEKNPVDRFDNVVENFVFNFTGRFPINGIYDFGRDILLLFLEDIERS